MNLDNFFNGWRTIQFLNLQSSKKNHIANCLIIKGDQLFRNILFQKWKSCDPCTIYIIYGSHILATVIKEKWEQITGSIQVFWAAFFSILSKITTFSRFAIDIMLHGITKDIKKFRIKSDEVIWQGWSKHFHVASLFTVLGI